MPYPSGMKLTSLSIGGGSITSLGSEVLVRADVRLSHFIVWAADGSPIVPDSESLPRSGEIVVSLPQVDQTGFVDKSGHDFTGWAYTVTAYYRTKGAVTDYKVTKVVQPVGGQDLIDFELIPSGDPLAPVIGDLAVVTSINGLTGAIVMDALEGPAGADGSPGAQGIQGPPGTNGTNGAQGIQGVPGVKGDKGDTGDDGAPGTPGTNGTQGIQGVKGDTGIQGIQGIPGVKGDTGAPGADGAAGTTTWGGITDKPTTFAPTIGATSMTAKAGNYAPSYADIPAGSVIVVNWDGTGAQPERPTARTDMYIRWRQSTIPANAISGDEWMSTVIP